MKLRKILFVMCVCIAMVFAFAACGGDSGAESEDTGEAVAEEEAGDGAADYSTIAGEWTVGGIIDPNDDFYEIADVEEIGMDASQLEATIVFDEEGNLNYAAMGQELGGTCTFDGETISITFENGYEMPMQYDAEYDELLQSNEDAGITLVYYRAEE